MNRQMRLERTALLLSPAQMERLEHAHVMLFGLGGVGGHAAEALARGGVGKMTIVDHDMSPLPTSTASSWRWKAPSAFPRRR